MIGWIILIALFAIIVFLIGMYNSLVRLKVTCDNAWADIDVQLKRRYDLIPNLVETVKGYAGHEKGTLEAVINARNRAMTATGPGDKAQAENMLSGALKSLFALSEAYPQLRAIESFTSLQTSLTQIEYFRQHAGIQTARILRSLRPCREGSAESQL
jgi:LemA protein